MSGTRRNQQGDAGGKEELTNGTSRPEFGEVGMTADDNPPSIRTVMSDHHAAMVLEAEKSGNDSIEESIPERQSLEQHPALGRLNIAADERDMNEPPSSTGNLSRSGSSPAIWSNWRRDTDKPSSDWASATKSGSTAYQRRDQGIKVLKPLRSSSRAFSSSSNQTSTSASAIPQQSRFFDEGRRRVSNDGNDTQLKRAVSSEQKPGGSGKECSSASGSSKPRVSNPVGGASAFAWLNSGGAAR
ncbi:hypothetical protein LTS18_014934 [Coniosporium uncinatum]|uniref:Uncharacterized protein n=1 Tax=Coniosporium uncinatum TaxID=93489 RepID=A0ACC3DGN3_9PEZI|nr:hypothetical protein LTS18_014934 [Coniosporium uncinatum]